MGWLSDNLGGLIGSVLGFKGQKDANKQNIALAREQMAFQERMSNSAYQRAMKDMKLAGLNPILSAKQPASTPGGASTRVDSAIGAGVQAFNQTNSALATASSARATARATNAKAVKDEFMNTNFFNKNLPPEQQKVNAALAQTGMNSALITLAAEAINKLDFPKFENIIKSASTEMGVQMTKEYIKEFYEGLRAFLTPGKAWDNYKWDPKEVRSAKPPRE